MRDKGESPSNNNAQIWLAVIGLIGALGGGAIANWDKLFPHPAVPPIASESATPGLPFTRAAANIGNGVGAIREIPSVGPSFDCAKARSRSEHWVCSSPELVVLDLAMANGYRDAAARVGTKERKAALRNQQNQWLRDREACADVGCLKDAYEQRIRELGAIQR